MYDLARALAAIQRRLSRAGEIHRRHLRRDGTRRYHPRGTSLRRRRESHGRGRLGSTHGNFDGDVRTTCRSPTTTPPTLTESSTPRPSRRWAPGRSARRGRVRNILRVILPEARRSGLCAAWRAVRGRVGGGARGKHPGRAHVRVGSPRGRGTSRGFPPRVRRDRRVVPPKTRGSPSTRAFACAWARRRARRRRRVSKSRPARRRRVSTLELEASRADGAWDGEIAASRLRGPVAMARRSSRRPVGSRPSTPHVAARTPTARRGFRLRSDR